MRRLAFVVSAFALVLAFPAMGSAKSPQIEIHFIPQGQFKDYIPEYVDGNIGFFCVHWNGAGACTRATILIASDVTSQAERLHAIREEITQSLGLMQDSYTYPDSIFYQRWTPGTEFAPIDRTVIRMLYSKQIRPKMTAEQAREVLSGSYSQKEIDYFCEIAFGSEYAEQKCVIHKWTHSADIEVYGQPTQRDVQEVTKVVGELNALISPVRLRIVGWNIEDQAALAAAAD